MTTECAEVAYAVVDPKGVNRPDNEATEDIVSMWITADEFKALVPKLAKNVMIEYDLAMFMLGKSY